MGRGINHQATAHKLLFGPGARSGTKSVRLSAAELKEKRECESRQAHQEMGGEIFEEDGSVSWTLNGQLHREGGPALECSNGTREWHVNGQLHRLDGPALECSNGRRE